MKFFFGDVCRRPIEEPCDDREEIYKHLEENNATTYAIEEDGLTSVRDQYVTTLEDLREENIHEKINIIRVLNEYTGEIKKTKITESTHQTSLLDHFKKKQS